MEELSRAMNILHGSIRYEFEGTILTVTGYYSGESISLDLGKLTEEMLEELQPDTEEDEEDWEEEEEA